MQIPFIIKDILSEIVLTNTGLNLLGITLAVLTVLEELIDTEIDPILSEDSDIEIKHPFSNIRNFTIKFRLLADIIVLRVNSSNPLSCIILLLKLYKLKYLSQYYFLNTYLFNFIPYGLK